MQPPPHLPRLPPPLLPPKPPRFGRNHRLSHSRSHVQCSMSPPRPLPSPPLTPSTDQCFNVVILSADVRTFGKLRQNHLNDIVAQPQAPDFRCWMAAAPGMDGGRGWHVAVACQVNVARDDQGVIRGSPWHRPWRWWWALGSGLHAWGPEDPLGHVYLRAPQLAPFEPLGKGDSAFAPTRVCYGGSSWLPTMERLALTRSSRKGLSRLVALPSRCYDTAP